MKFCETSKKGKNYKVLWTEYVHILSMCTILFVSIFLRVRMNERTNMYLEEQ